MVARNGAAWQELAGCGHIRHHRGPARALNCCHWLWLDRRETQEGAWHSGSDVGSGSRRPLSWPRTCRNGPAIRSWSGPLYLGGPTDSTWDPTHRLCLLSTWTGGGNAPSAKLSVWNEAMLYFMVAPPHYRKILVALDDRRGLELLAAHYVKRFAHLVPTGVEIWELASDGRDGRLVHKGA